jgi:hypothetical protein
LIKKHAKYDGIEVYTDIDFARAVAKRMQPLFRIGKYLEHVEFPIVASSADNAEEYLNRLLFRDRSRDEDLNSCIAFDTIIATFAEHLENGIELHPIASRWLAKYLRGEIRRPTPPKRPSRTGRRDHIFSCAIEGLRRMGLPPTRGESSKSNCGCEVVAKAAGKMGIASISYGATKKIWEAADKSLWRDD